jgi:hypothetical protein
VKSATGCYNILVIYKTIILPVVLYGCETCSLTLREEHRLRVFENGVLRRKFGPKRDEVTGRWIKLHNEELQKLLLSGRYKYNYQVNDDKMGRECSTHEEGFYKNFEDRGN